MTVSRLLGIAFVFVCASVAWFTLGTSLVVRSGENDVRHKQEVELLWGGPHLQTAPIAHAERPGTVTETVTDRDDAGKAQATRRVTRPRIELVAAPLVSSRIAVQLALQHRQRGLLWYDTYGVTFRGAYVFRNPDPAARTVLLRFDFPKRCTTFDDVVFAIDGTAVAIDGDVSKGATARVEVGPGAEVRLDVGYRSRGLDTWTYAFAEDGVAQVRDTTVVMTTDFDGVDFPPGTMAPGEKARTGDGWRLHWAFSNLVTAQRIGMDLPNRLNPGPLASRITFFAPVSLLFFFTVMLMLGVTRGESLHPVNYFFLAAAFFAFHLLLAYLVDHVSIHAAFAVASAISVFLVVSYLRLVTGMRRALLHAGAAQFVFLVLFSYAFFFEGYTGLTVTVGAIVTLFALMQMTAHVRWDEVIAMRLPVRGAAG